MITGLFVYSGSVKGIDVCGVAKCLVGMLQGLLFAHSGFCCVVLRYVTGSFFVTD